MDTRNHPLSERPKMDKHWRILDGELRPVDRLSAFIIAAAALAAMLLLIGGCSDPVTVYHVPGTCVATGQKVLVMPFMDTRTFVDDGDPHRDDLGVYARDIYVAAMRENPLSREAVVLTPDMADQEKSLSNAEVAEIGRRHGADVVVAGQVFSFTDTRAASIPPRAGMFIRVISANDGALLFVGDHYQSAAVPGAPGGRDLQARYVATRLIEGLVAQTGPALQAAGRVASNTALATIAPAPVRRGLFASSGGTNRTRPRAPRGTGNLQPASGENPANKDGEAGRDEDAIPVPEAPPLLGLSGATSLNTGGWDDVFVPEAPPVLNYNDDFYNLPTAEPEPVAAPLPAASPGTDGRADAGQATDARTKYMENDTPAGVDPVAADDVETATRIISPEPVPLPPPPMLVEEAAREEAARSLVKAASGTRGGESEVSAVEDGESPEFSAVSTNISTDDGSDVAPMAEASEQPDVAVAIESAVPLADTAEKETVGADMRAASGPDVADGSEAAAAPVAAAADVETAAAGAVVVDGNDESSGEYSDASYAARLSGDDLAADLFASDGELWATPTVAPAAPAVPAPEYLEPIPVPVPVPEGGVMVTEVEGISQARTGDPFEYVTDDDLFTAAMVAPEDDGPIYSTALVVEQPQPRPFRAPERMERTERVERERVERPGRSNGSDMPPMLSELTASPLLAPAVIEPTPALTQPQPVSRAARILILPYHDRENPNNLISATGGGEVVTTLYGTQLALDSGLQVLWDGSGQVGHDRLISREDAILMGRQAGAGYVVRGQVVEFRRAQSVPSFYSAVISTAVLAAQIFFAEFSGVDVATEVYRVADGRCIMSRRDRAQQKYVVQAEKTVRKLAAGMSKSVARVIRSENPEEMDPLIDEVEPVTVFSNPR